MFQSAAHFARQVRRAASGFVLLAGAAIAGLPFAANAAPEKRVALVIGNSTYKEAPALPNPKNDAEDMAATLRDVGFEVTVAGDLDKRSMDATLARFNRAAKGASVALFYFAGHGMQYNGGNYLLPVDAKLEDDVGLRYEAISLDQVRAAVEEASGVKIIILDACRNNPLASNLARSFAGNTRAVSPNRGLARIEQTTGMVVAYATQANQVAEDGGGRNSPFTQALIENLREPGVEIASLFRRVASSVHDRTRGRQVPELSISLLNEFYLNERETDTQAWTRVRETTDAGGLRDFVARYPQSALADAARARLDVILRAESEFAERVERERREREAREEKQRQLLARIAELKRELGETPAVETPRQPAIAPTPRVEAPAQPAATPAVAVEPVRVAALPASPATAPVPPVVPEKVTFARFRNEMHRLGCHAAGNEKDWNGPAVKRALGLFAKQASLEPVPARLAEDQIDLLEKRKARLCPSQCNARQVETASGACVAKTCGRGEMLDADGDCVDRPVPRAVQVREKPAPRNRVVERPVERRVAQRPVRERVVAERPRRQVEAPVVTEYRPRCSPGPTIGIGFGPIRFAAPLGRC